MARARKKGVIQGDRTVHAVVLRLTGPKTLCGAGRIALTLPERFDPADKTACSACAALVRAGR